MNIELNKTIKTDCFAGLASLSDNAVDHSFTSPPYNRKRNDKYNFYDDTLVDYETFIDKVLSELLRVSSGYVFFNIQKNYYNKNELLRLMGKWHENIVEIITWTKSNPMPASGKNITNSFEFILVLNKDKKPLKSNRTYTKNHIQTNVFSNNPYTKVHRAVMHPEVADSIIKDFTLEGQTVLDPFMGVGTTAVSCFESGRYFIGFDITEEYVDISNERIACLLGGVVVE